jgi:hypothetical protein
MGSDLNRYFSQMGARVKVLEGLAPVRHWRMARNSEEAQRIGLDIGRDKHGEFFEIRTVPDSEQEIVVLNVQPRERHLLLLTRQFGERGRVLAKQKFLCGHDERHWFVAAIPENEPVSTVAGAKIALKPEEIRTREGLLGISRKASFQRRNSAFIRQGEWFFVPTALSVDARLVLKDERLSRGNGGKPHWAEECYRSGGETVYVSAKYPTGLTAQDYKKLPAKEQNLGFATMKRDAAVYVRGKISHPDHETVTLRGWHQVFMNTENRAKAMRFLAFLD